MIINDNDIKTCNDILTFSFRTPKVVLRRLRIKILEIL